MKGAKRSGYIKPIESENVQTYKDYLVEGLSKYFRPSKTKEGLIVQKTEFSIESFGEKQDIPFKAMRERSNQLSNMMRI